MSDDAWEEWSPAWAQHVRGRFTRPVVEDGVRQEQRVEASCAWPGCGAVWRGTCASGRVRAHVARFAAVHAHRDALGSQRKAQKQGA